MLPFWAPYGDYLPLRLSAAISSSHSHTCLEENSGGRFFLLIPAPLVIKGSTSTSLIGSLLLFFLPFFFLFLFFFANRHPTTAYPEERSRGGESEDTPAHTVPGVHGKDAADNMRWISSTVPNWKFILYLHWNQIARWAQLVIHFPNTSVQQEHQITSRWEKRCLHVCMKLKQLYLSFPFPLNVNTSRSIL